MLKLLLGHRHDAAQSPIHRAPAGVKLALGLVMIVATVFMPAPAHAWFFAVAAVLLWAALTSRISLVFLMKRLLLLSPFVLGVLLVNVFQPTLRDGWPVLVARAGLCLFTVILLSNTTPFGKVLSVLRWARVPGVLVTTLALMHRYLFVLIEESERMRRARQSRSFVPRRQARGRGWRILGSVVGHLFLRASERAERIYAAMCARGWK